MRELSALIADGYDHNTYNIECRWMNLLQQDREFIMAAFERMVQNSECYVEDMEHYVPKILDLGCGCGVPYTRELSGYGKVLGCDVSSNQVGCARLNVPKARFVNKDVMDLHLMRKYDMVTMFNSFFNIAMNDKQLLLCRINYWMSQYGVAVMTTYGEETFRQQKDDFYGAPMIWYHISPRDFEKMVTRAGLCVIEHDTRDDLVGSKTMHLWILERLSQKGFRE